ncbi:FSH1 serine hydrolase [Helicosporidium sp. ATCC 50920]|nr:FSH1 serine hydrolase [Helicosporidium sp. ATCC 50920]|eukprot:KDD73675.1 FSH1 serine hydrolase [Helicosporidium sp. ATCC 50920]
MESTPKLRLLCLHGYLQTGDAFRVKSGSLRKALRSRAELIYMDAPHVAPPLPKMYLFPHRPTADDDGDCCAGAAPTNPSQEPSHAPAPEAPGRCWWFARDGSNPGLRPSQAQETDGWPEARAAIAEALIRHAPIHGLLGFSQGAAAAALFLCENPSAASKLDCLILASGFVPADPELSAAVHAGAAAGLKLPSLHIMGQRDAIIPSERSRLLKGLCTDASLLEHPGGHRLPNATGADRDVLRAFVEGVRAAAEKRTQ